MKYPYIHCLYVLLKNNVSICGYTFYFTSLCLHNNHIDWNFFCNSCFPATIIFINWYKFEKKQGQRKAWRIPSPKNLTRWPWQSIGFHSPNDYVCTKFGQNPLKDNMWKNLTRWPWPLTLKMNRVPDSPKHVPSLVKIHWRMLILESSQGCYRVKIWPLTLKINRVPDSPKD
jgi:hypothetical protein